MWRDWILNSLHSRSSQPDKRVPSFRDTNVCSLILSIWNVIWTYLQSIQHPWNGRRYGGYRRLEKNAFSFHADRRDSRMNQIPCNGKTRFHWIPWFKWNETHKERSRFVLDNRNFAEFYISWRDNILRGAVRNASAVYHEERAEGLHDSAYRIRFHDSVVIKTSTKALSVYIIEWQAVACA